MQGIFKSKLLLLIIIPVLGWLSLSFIKIKIHEDIVNKEVGSLETKISNLESNNNSLEKFVQYMTQSSFLEKEARLKLNYKAPGENVVFVYPDENIKSSVSVNFHNQLAQMPNYLKWAYYLMGY